MPLRQYSKGARKARTSMMRRYGAKKGKRIFYSKANKYGKGKSRRAKVNSVYSKGSHRVKRSRRRKRR